jgi:hypothetical protein
MRNEEGKKTKKKRRYIKLNEQSIHIASENEMEKVQPN